MTKKFSQFVEGSIPRTTDIVVGLRDNTNTQFNFSGVNDEYGNKIVQWQSYNNLGRNYISFTNSPAGVPVVIEAEGVDANVGLTVSSKASGNLNLTSPSAGDVNIIIGGSGNINMTTNMGKVIVNETTGIDAILDEDDMASDSATAVPTQQSTKAYFDAGIGVLSNLTYITKTNETAYLPNSFALAMHATGFLASTTGTGNIQMRTIAGTANQLTVTNGDGLAGNPTLSFPTTVTFPGSIIINNGDVSLQGTGAITSTGIDINIAPDSGNAITLQTETVTIQKDLQHELESGNKISFTTGAQGFYVGGTEILGLSVSNITANKPIYTTDGEIVSIGTDLSLIPDGGYNIALESGIVTIQQDLVREGESTNRVSLTAGAQSYLVGGSSIMDLNASGFRVGGTGARITSISTDGTFAANSDTLAPTQKAAKTYADSTATTTKSYSYITKTDNTANLPNSVPLSGLGSGFLSNTTTTGVLHPRSMTGTANQIDVTNGDGVSAAPTFALSSTMVTPGTLNVGTTFTVGSTVSVDAISNSPSASSATGLMTSYAVQLAIANQVSSAKSFRGGYNASTNLFPSTGGSGTAGAILAGDVWVVTTPGTLGGTSVDVGATVLALTDTPGQTAGNWAININGVASWNGRAGVVVPVSGDYSFSLISGTAAVSQGGTGNTSVGSSGTFAYSDGSKYVFSAMTVPTSAGSSGTYWRSNGSNILSSTIQVADVPTLNQNTTGQAGKVANAATFDNSGTGAATGATFDGSATKTISYNTIGASPVAGSSSIVTVGTITSGIWQGTAVDGAHGGTGQTTTSVGDLLIGASSNTWSKLATNISSALTTSEFGALRWTNLGLGQVPMGSFTDGVVAGSIVAGTGLGASFGVGNITLALSVPVVGANGGTGQTTTSVGDLLVGAASNTWSKLAKANSSMLTTDGSGNPGWQAVTQYNVLSGGASGAINNIAPSTAGYVMTSNGASAQPTFQAAAYVPIPFNTVTSSTQALSINNSYYSTYAGICVMTLPSSAAVGSEIEFITDAAGHQIKLAQNSGQLIYDGAQNGVSVVTTTGTSGYLQTKATSPNTVFKVKCIVTDTTWEVIYANNEIDWN